MASSDSPKHRVQLELPDLVAESVAAVEAAGGAVWVVGGAVRDSLLGLPVRDWDLATALPPDRLRAALPGAVLADPKLGWVALRSGPQKIVFTTFRAEGDYGPDRQPGWVRFVDDPAVDARRRDFTVNAIYADPHSGALLDPEGGVDDLRARVLRVIGPAEERLCEDPLRALRAVRIAASAGLQLADETVRALRRVAPACRRLSAERTWQELTLAFSGRAGRGRALRLLLEVGVARVVLAEPAGLFGDAGALERTAGLLDAVHPGAAALSWAAVLCDLDPPAEGPVGRRAHAPRTEAVLRRLRAPRAVREAVVELCAERRRIESVAALPRSQRDRWLRWRQIDPQLEFHRARCEVGLGDPSRNETLAGQLRAIAGRPSPALIAGDDVLALGVPSGPMVGEILRLVVAELDTRPAPSRDDALALARRIVASCVKDDTRGADRT